MSKLYVLISGKRLSGKDTVGQTISTIASMRMLPPPEILHLADAIKLELMEQYPEIPSLEEMHDNSSPIKKKFRPAMIKLGQERRAEDVDYWCRKVYEIGQQSDADVILVPDCRFVNEVRYFQNKEDIDTITIRIETLTHELARRGKVFTNGIDDDVSEISLDVTLDEVSWDYILVDGGGVYQLTRSPVLPPEGQIAKLFDALNPIVTEHMIERVQHEQPTDAPRSSTEPQSNHASV